MTQPPAKPSTRTLLSNLTLPLEAFRAHREEVPLHMLVVFLHIAQREGIGAAELMRLTGLSQASVSRNIHALGQGKGGEPGLGLVTQTIDPSNTRARIVKLTPKGIALAKEMVGQSNVTGEAGPSSKPNQAQSRHVHWQNWID